MLKMVKSSPKNLDACNPEKEDRFNRVLDQYGEFLSRTIAQVCPRDLGLDLSEIIQEARLKLWRALESEREILHLGSYIYRIAVTATINAVRRVKARREEQLSPDCDAEEGDEDRQGFLADDPRKAPDRLAEQGEIVRKIEEALKRLPENRRLAAGLYLEGMTTGEIGDLMGWSEPKARNLAYRALNDLRRELRLMGIEYP